MTDRSVFFTVEGVNRLCFQGEQRNAENVSFFFFFGANYSPCFLWQAVFKEHSGLDLRADLTQGNDH